MIVVRTHLVRQITALEAQVSADVLVNGPSELVVQLPCDKGEDDGCEGHEGGHSDEHGLDVLPEVCGNKGLGEEDVGSIPDLIVLDAGVDENADIVDDDANDLNRVLHAQGVPDEEELVEVAEHEDGEVGGDGAALAADLVGLKVQVGAEAAEDIAVGGVSWWVLGQRGEKKATYDSRPMPTAACRMAVTIKAQDHRVVGMYILGARRVGGGKVVGKPSRWW
jgi:hypothetical protein